MENSSKSKLDKMSVRFAMMILVTILLNFGMFFILNFLAPLITGVIVGFLLVKIRDGISVSFSGTIISYFIIFLISEWFLGFRNTALDIAIAILIMGILGTAGGIIGSIISVKVKR